MRASSCLLSLEVGENIIVDNISNTICIHSSPREITHNRAKKKKEPTDPELRQQFSHQTSVLKSDPDLRLNR